MTDTNTMRAALRQIAAMDTSERHNGNRNDLVACAAVRIAHAALAAAAQPAPVDRETLVEVIEDALYSHSDERGWEPTGTAQSIADALLARGLRLPGDTVAERDAAFEAGQESMRERAAKLMDESDTPTRTYLAAAIRTLPIKPRPE